MAVLLRDVLTTIRALNRHHARTIPEFDPFITDQHRGITVIDDIPEVGVSHFKSNGWFIGVDIGK